MKKHIKSLTIIIMLVYMVNIINISSYARSITLQDKNITVGKVIEVISGEAIKVMEYSKNGDNKVVLIKMIGIDTESSQEAMDYTYNDLLGKTVMLLPDSYNNTFKQMDNFVYRYVYNSPIKSVSEELLEVGFAKVDDTFKYAQQYSDLLEVEAKAKESKLGRWYDYSSKNVGSIVNINTATSTMLSNYLEDTPISVASSIVNYRIYNPYNSIEEIKFASPHCTKDWFDKNKDRLSVVTDISTASHSEISSLFYNTSLSDEMADKILQYRLFNTITSVDEIKTITGLKTYYKKMQKFIVLKPTKKYIENDAKVVNLNTASTSEIRSVSLLSQHQSEQIVRDRKNQKYIFKSLGELQKAGKLTKYQVDRYGDNFSVFTNLNTALENELKSLFGSISINTSSRDMIVKNIIKYRPYTSKKQVRNVIGVNYYKKISPYIYTTESYNPEYININITDRNYAASILGMSENDTKYYTKSHVRYKGSSNISFNYTNYNMKFSLVTNINTASKYELDHLYARIWEKNKYEYVKVPSDIIKDIIEFREEVPFSSLEEVSKIFNKHGKINIYNYLKDYIVFY